MADDPEARPTPPQPEVTSHTPLGLDHLYDSADTDMTDAPPSPPSPADSRRKSAHAETEKILLPSPPTQSMGDVAPVENSKDDDATESAPYGTRSRNRVNSTRPNYTEEPDLDFEYAIVEPENSSTKRSTVTEIQTQFRQDGDSATLPATGGWRAANGHAAHQHLVTSEASTPQPTIEPPPERKKRKYERHAPKVSANQSRASPTSGKEGAIPGTSHFSVNPNGSSEAPPAKKRKTTTVHPANASSPATPPAAVVPAGRPTRFAIRVSGVVSFEKCKYLLNNKGQLVADDGDIYSVDGTFNTRALCLVFVNSLKSWSFSANHHRSCLPHK